MGTTITFRRGENDPTSGSGLTLSEPAFNTTLKTFHIGLGHGITAAWVGAPISGLSAEIAAGITYKTPTLKAVKDYVTDYVTAVNGVLTVNGFAGGITLNAGTALGLTSSSGNITLTNLGVQSFNGLTGAVGGVTTSVANTFVPMQSFSAGISAAGGTFTQRTVFISGIQSAGITASTVTSEGTSTISGYPGYASTTTVSPDTIKFVFDGAGGQILRPTDDNIDGSTRTNYLPASSGTLALTSQLMGAVNGSTAATTAVTSFNGLTGAVGGVCAAQANTFTALQSFNSGVTFGSTIDATGAARLSGGLTASRIDVTGNFKVVGDAQIGDQNTDAMTVFAGTTFNNRVDFGGTNVFANGLTSAGNIRFSGTNAKQIISQQASLSIIGATTGAIASSDNRIVLGVQTTDSLAVYSATGIVDISTNSPTLPIIPSIRFNTDDYDIIGQGSIKIQPLDYATAARTQYLQNASGTIALTSQLMGAVNGSTAATTAVTSFNGLTGAVTGVTVGGVNTFTQVNTFSAGISAAGSTFASTTNTLDVIASTEGAGLRIARAASGVGSRIGGIRFGRSTTSSQNTYLEGSSGTFSLYNGVDNTGTAFASFSTSQFSLGTTSASFISLNCPNNISFGDTSNIGNNQQFAISGTNRTYAFGDPTGVTTGFVGINRSGLCGDYALEVNSPTGKGLQLIYNDHTGAASNWVNMDVSSGGNFTVRPSGGLATVTGTLNVSAGLCAAGGTFSGDIAVNGGDITTTSTTATLYNTTATTVNIGAAATTVSIAGNTAGMTFGMGSYHKFKTNRKTTTSTSQTEIFRFNYVNPLNALVGGDDAAYAEIIITAEQTDGSPGYCSGTQITKILVAATPGDGVVNHVEYGNVNTNGNLATYTASGSLDDVLIYATPVSSATTVFKVFATLIRGEFGVGI